MPLGMNLPAHIGSTPFNSTQRFSIGDVVRVIPRTARAISMTRDHDKILRVVPYDPSSFRNEYNTENAFVYCYGGTGYEYWYVLREVRPNGTMSDYDRHFPDQDLQFNKIVCGDNSFIPPSEVI